MMSPTNAAALMPMHHQSLALLRSAAIGTMAFLTLVDLFATQAILPALTTAYGVSPAAMGVAVNASTIGMAVASLVVSLVSNRIDRRLGIISSLVVLAVPTALLAFAPDLKTFTALRIMQGLCMASAFTLTLAYLSERCGAAEAASAFAAYIAGNVASNLIGRFMSAALVDHLGLAWNFYVFAALNLAGGILVYFTVGPAARSSSRGANAAASLRAWSEHLRNRQLGAAFAVGFCILFAFIGTFTYINFVLVREPLALGMMQLGFVYLVFLPSIVITLCGGWAVQRWGTRATIRVALGVGAAGVPLLALPYLPAVLLGMILLAVGTFLAQAVTTGFVGHAATGDSGSASGLYLASYFSGGLVGTAVLGQVFDQLGWSACLVGIALALALAALVAERMRSPSEEFDTPPLSRSTSLQA
ncbi:MAG: MFS transporter [Xanthobacteraceae bacterium]